MRTFKSDVGVVTFAAVDESYTQYTATTPEVSVTGPLDVVWPFVQAYIELHHMHEVCSECEQTLNEFEIGRGTCVDCHVLA